MVGLSASSIRRQQPDCSLPPRRNPPERYPDTIHAGQPKAALPFILEALEPLHPEVRRMC